MKIKIARHGLTYSFGFVQPVSEKSLKLSSNLSDHSDNVEKSSQDIQHDQGSIDNVKKPCHDWQGKVVPIGEKYAPNNQDLCTQCICNKQGFPTSCHSVRCSPPLNCPKAELIKGTCCEYVCNDNSGQNDGNSTTNGNDNKDEGESITNLSLRLIASTVTSFLVLALLLFMVHRLRQRRLLQAMRRFEARARQVHSEDTDSEPYIPDGFMSVECPPYTDPPPPYSPPKPPQIMPGEQPPPYEEIHQNGENNSVTENRNDNSCGSNSGTSGPVAPAAASVREAEAVVVRSGSDVMFQPNTQSRPVDPRHQQSIISGGGPLRAPNTLPAYASTDVIDGLGVVITPGNDLVSYSPYNDGWAMWLRGASAQMVHEPFSQQNGMLTRDRPRSLVNPGTCRIQTMPTITAFQRFSNIFKRDSWKARNRRRHGRPVSEYGNLHHYATIPRHEVIAAADAPGIRPPDDARNTSRVARNRLPDRMCLSYDSSQEAYTTGYVSPSSSSSNSSSSAENPLSHYTSSSAVATSSSGISPQVRTGSMYNNQTGLNTVDTVHFKSEPDHHSAASCHANVITSSSSEWANGGSTSFNQSHSEPSASAINDQAPSDPRLPSRPQMTDCLPDGATGPWRQASIYNSPNNTDTYKSLGSFIRSNPSTSIVNSREHVSVRNGDILAHQDTAHSSLSSDYLELSPSDTLPKFFSTLPLKSFQSSRPSSKHEVEQRQPSVELEHPASTSSSSPTQSPSPPAASSGAGIMRRSLSAVSQTSIFSVCSETGEKKLKSFVDKYENDDGKVLMADSQYPDYQTLPTSRGNTSTQTFQAGGSTVQSMSDMYEAMLNTSDFTRQELSTESNGLEQKEYATENYDISRTQNPQLKSCSIQNQVAFSPSTLPLQTGNHSASDSQRSSPPGAEISNYNLNCLLSDKSPLSKELPSLYEDLLKSPSVNISGSECNTKAVKDGSHLNGLNQVESAVKPEKCHESVKKQKKKRSKDRTASSPQVVHLSKSKHNSGSPKHVRVHVVERKKLEETADDRVKLSRSSDKKLKTQREINKPTVRFSESHNANKLMTRSLCDGAMVYGNADVYRSLGSDSFSASLPHPLQSSFCPTFTDPWVHQDHQEFLLTSNRTVLNDLNQPPGHLPQSPAYLANQPSNHALNQIIEASVAMPVMSTLCKLPESNSQLRKKTAHRRAAPGEKLHVPSPSRHKTRPKSLVASLDITQDKKDASPRTAAGAGDTSAVAASRGAKSGFGYDLNFVDQNRISDWYSSQEAEFSHKRCAQGFEAPYHTNNASTFKFTSKTDSNTEVPSAGNKAPVIQHPANKSGLSNELSFVIRTSGNASRSKKRQSVPAAVSTFLPQNHLVDRAVVVGNISKQDDGDVPSKVRGDKSNDMRHDRMTVSDDYSEATSYV
ncbi:hypothetical protein Btru_064038 [Bulinus truncatus]|nr:hypothetical protein Btru_064038 [Bulinus truncatus]